MNQNLKTAIVDSISNVLETMLFMTLEFEEDSSLVESGILSNENLACCKLDFKGALSGVFFLMIPETLLKDMAADFMGIDIENVKNEHTTGTINEVTNMIVGNSFGLYDDTLIVQLGIPQFIKKRAIEEAISIEGSDEFFLKVNTPESVFAAKVVMS